MFKTWLISFLVIIISFIVGTKNAPQPQLIQTQDDYDSTETTAIFQNSPLLIPKSLAQIPQHIKVLGDSNVEKRIYVDLTNQMLYAYEGENLVYSFLVSTGKWGKTPTGVFTIWSKFRYIKMSGGSTALHTYYYLPNVPFTMFFSNSKIAASRGFALHGTYWHSNFGHPMSHGCVNMKTEEAGIIYDWSSPHIPEGKKSIRSTNENPGTQIIIFGKSPPS